MQQPKVYQKKFRNRNTAYGTERRLNLVKETMYQQPHFPKTVSYEDIDRAVYDWLDKEIDVSRNGERFPTYKLFSNKRASEYGQTWKQQDDKGNLELNFKTISRENTPKNTDKFGSLSNIPKDITFSIIEAPVMQQDGRLAVERYSMKQPTYIAFTYIVSIYTDSYPIVNEVSKMILKEFRSIQRYVFPNGFAMPMKLTNVSDDSEYSIDDRKYYSQSYTIELSGFVIDKDDYVVETRPSRIRYKFVAGENSSNRKKGSGFILDSMLTDSIKLTDGSDNNDNNNNNGNVNSNCGTNNAMFEIDDTEKPIEDYGISLIVDENVSKCFEGTEYEKYVARKYILTVSIDPCDPVREFEIDSTLEVESIELKNIQSFKMYINGIDVDTEKSDVMFTKGDIIKVECKAVDEKNETYIRFICIDENDIVENSQENFVEEEI